MGYWLLMGWYRTKRLTHCGHFLIYCESPSEFQSFLIHPPELSRKHQQKHLIANQEKVGEKWSWILQKLSRVMGPTALFLLRRKSYYRLLSLLKINRPRPVLNPWTLSPVASNITIRPPMSTCKGLLTSHRNVCNHLEGYKASRPVSPHSAWFTLCLKQNVTSSFCNIIMLIHCKRKGRTFHKKYCKNVCYLSRICRKLCDPHSDLSPCYLPF
jgi:hypothetical protein